MSISKEELKQTIPNLTHRRLNDIKNKGSYASISDLYFKKGELKMDLSLPVYELDMVRSLLISKPFCGKVKEVTRIIDHITHPRLTESVVSMIWYGEHDCYNRSDKYDLTEIKEIRTNRDWKNVDKELLDMFTKSYSIGKPDITDFGFDELLEEYLRVNGESNRPFTRQKQSDSINDIVGTLEKSYGVRNAMRENQLTFMDWINKKKIMHGVFLLQPKFDGCSVAFDFDTERFFTRGDYDNGESVDVTDLFKSHINKIKQYAIKGTTAMKFEAILSHEYFDDENMGIYAAYKRPRDFVSATIASRKIECADIITLVPLRGYINGKQYIPEALVNCLLVEYNDYTTIENFIKRLLDDNTTTKFEGMTYSVDGVVASMVDEHSIIDVDREVAIKIIFDVKKTHLKNIEYTVGKQGRITPVAILEPVKFGNVEVDHVTLSTLDRVVSLNLRYNDTVNVMYNIVPYLIDSEGDGDIPITIPDKCPVCGARLEYITLKQVRCSNPDCRACKIGAIVRHVNKMKMYGLSEGIVTRLFDEGIIYSISDIYHLRDWDETIPGLDGFGLKSFHNMINSVEESVKKATLAQFLGSLPINDTDEKTWKQIINVMGEDKVIDLFKRKMFIEELMQVGYIPGIGEIKIKKIIDGIRKNEKEIYDLMSWIPYKLNLKKKKPLGDTPPYDYAGKIAMSGTRDEEVKEGLEFSGYEVQDNLTKDCVGLIIPDENFTSSKVNKAKEWGIKIYTLEEAKEFLIHPF